MASPNRLIILFGLGLAAVSFLSASAAEREESAMVSAIWLNPNAPPSKPVECYVQVGEVVWLHGEESAALLVLAQGMALDRPLIIIGSRLSDGLKSFTPDSLRVVNFSSTTLISQIGNEVKTIDAGYNFMVRYPSVSVPGRPPLSHLSVKFFGGDLLYSSEVDALQGSGTILLIFKAKDEDKQKSIPVA